MPQPQDVSDFARLAEPMIEVAAAYLLDKIRLSGGEHEDLVQELWLALLLRWSAQADQRYGATVCLPYPPLTSDSELRRRVALDVIRAAHAVLRGFRRYHQQHGRVLESWFACRAHVVQHAGCAERDLRSDLTTAIRRLPPELRALCGSLTNSGANVPCTPADSSTSAALAQLRHVFRTHDLHEYL